MNISYNFGEMEVAWGYTVGGCFSVKIIRYDMTCVILIETYSFEQEKREHSAIQKREMDYKTLLQTIYWSHVTAYSSQLKRKSIYA